MKNIIAVFRALDKSNSDIVLPELYDILYGNMSIISPTSNNYDDGKKRWLSYTASALSREQRQIILIHVGNDLVGYFQYYVSDGIFMMEEIQVKSEYHGSGIFSQLCCWMIMKISTDTQYVEAYANKKNTKLQAILKNLGLEAIGENKNGDSWRFRGDYKKFAEHFESDSNEKIGYCGNHCAYCFYDKCPGCRSKNPYCSYATLFADCKCPNVTCCKEKKIEGCWQCSNLESCSVGFFSSGENDAKAYALFIKKYGKEKYTEVIGRVHTAGYDYPKSFKKINDVDRIYKILEQFL